MIRAIRELTSQQRVIAEGIGEGLSYAEIARAFSPKLSVHTVRAHVRAMANLIDTDEGALSPRERIFMLVKHEHWEAKRAERP